MKAGRWNLKGVSGYWFRMTVAGVLGLLVSLLSYLHGSALERSLAAREFERLAQVQFQNTQELLRHSTQVLLAFRGFFAASDGVDRAEYARFAKEILPHYPEIFAVHWAPRIGPGQQEDFEREIRGYQATPLGIFDVDDQARQTVSAAPRREYFPVRYSEPLEANRKVIGLDTLERPYNQAAIREAANRGTPMLTPVFPLIQDPDGPLAVALYQPVFRNGLPVDTAEQRWQALEGYLILMLRPSLLLEGLSFGDLKVVPRLYDLQQGKPVAIHPRGAPLLAPAENVVQHELQMPGRQWIMEFVASDGFAGSIPVQPLLLMLSLLLLTLAILVFLDHSHRVALALQEANGELLCRQRELDSLAHHDALTGLPNRLLLYDRIGMALAARRRQGGSLAVCVLDLDGFKAINDRFGHPAGDVVLREVARRILAAVRPSDTVARLGGDEFVVVLPAMAASAALQRAMQRLVAQVGQPIALGHGGVAVAVSASVGIALAAGHDDVDSLIRQADAAMYAAKNAGKGCYRIFAATDARDAAQPPGEGRGTNAVRDLSKEEEQCD